MAISLVDIRCKKNRLIMMDIKILLQNNWCCMQWLGIMKNKEGKTCQSKNLARAVHMSTDMAMQPCEAKKGSILFNDDIIAVPGRSLCTGPHWVGLFAFVCGQDLVFVHNGHLVVNGCRLEEIESHKQGNMTYHKFANHAHCCECPWLCAWNW